MYLPDDVDVTTIETVFVFAFCTRLADRGRFCTRAGKGDDDGVEVAVGGGRISEPPGKVVNGGRFDSRDDAA